MTSTETTIHRLADELDLTMERDGRRWRIGGTVVWYTSREMKGILQTRAGRNWSKGKQSA